jgi:hypothetical protein
MVMGLPPAPGDVIVTEPLNVPIASPVAFTATCTVAGVVPLAGVAVSQLPVLLVVVATVKFNGPGVPVTGTFAVRLEVLPKAAVNVSGVVFAEIPPVVTCRVTGIIRGLLLAKFWLTITLPWYVPGVRPEPFTDTVAVPDLLP